MMFVGASRLGFGCASLGSRIGDVAGRRALAAAFDQGITWYDLAPSYGDGRAESIFGNFAKDRRDKLFICTKCGIESRSPPMVAGLLRPLVRAVLTATPRMRPLITRARLPAHRIPLTGAFVRSSLERSLRRLRTDYVDVLALHEPTPEEADNEDIIRALEDAVKTGKARAAGVAGAAQTVAHVLTNRSEGNMVFSHVQVAALDYAQIGPLLGPPNQLPWCVTHSVFTARPTLATLPNDPLDVALRENSHGVVLASMFSAKHLAENIATLAKYNTAVSRLTQIPPEL